MDNQTLINVLEAHKRQVFKVELPKESSAESFWEPLTSDVYNSLPSLENRLDDKIKYAMQSFATADGESLDFLNKKGKLLKRFASYFKSYTGFKLEDRYLGVIGDKLQYYANQETRPYYVDFTDRVDWEDGQFGKSDSCWWGCYSDSREVFNEGGGWTIRFYRDPDDDQGIGRCFIVPKYNVLLCFNAYGIERAKVSKVIKAVFDSHGIELHYTRAEVYNSHNGDIPYINSDSSGGSSGSFVLHTSETFIQSKYDIDFEYEDDDRCICSDCGRRVDQDDAMHTGGECYCQRCHDDRFSFCYRCQEYCASSEVHQSRGQYDYICEYCARRIGAIMCESCDLYSTDYTHTQDGDSYCEECIDRNADSCDHCNEYYEDINRHNKTQHSICVECGEVLEDSDSLCDHVSDNHSELVIELAAY